MKILQFKTEEDAALVAQYLYHCRQDGAALVLTRPDPPAIDTAIGLAGVELAFIEGERCMLPFPKHERECCEDVPRIWVGCVSAYVCGYSHGMWIDATQDEDEIRDDINWMLGWSPMTGIQACEEWAIHCYEGFGDIYLSEFEAIATVSKVAQAYLEHGRAFAEFYDYGGYDTVEETVEGFLSRYIGICSSPADFAREQWDDNGTCDKLEEIGVCPDYINYEAVATEMETGGVYLFFDVGHEGTYVFHGY